MKLETVILFPHMLRLACSILALATVLASMLGGQDRPNILLIVSDDQGYRDLGSAGSPDIRTPNLDRLAAEGVRLTSYYSPFAFCTPARGAILTGRYPQRNGTYENFRNDRVDDGYVYPPDEYALSPERVLGMDTREVLLSNVLSEAGYATGIFGKWDLGQMRRYLPLQRGFDDFYGFVNTGIDYYTHERYGVPAMYRGNRPTTEDKGTYTTELFERETLRFLDEHKGEPWFVYLSYNAPHGASNLDRWIRGMGPQAPGRYLDLFPSSPSRNESRRRNYLAAVAAMDDSIGKVLHRIEQHGQTDNTLVIFVSDNGGGGGSDNAPLRGRKSWLFEGGVRVPFILRWPGHAPAGKVSDEFLTGLEIFPTLLAAAGVKPPAGVALDGFDMLPTLKGDTESPREEMIWRNADDYAVRMGDWKLVSSHRGSGLFDLSEDIGERKDLSRQLPDVLNRLKARYRAWVGAMEDAEPRGPYRDF